MSDIKIFRLTDRSVTQLQGRSVALEKSLQTLVDRYLETFLGIRLLASEHPTGKTHGGRIDTLGIDENGCPCIIEYKRASNENVLNQGLFYLNWLLDHKSDFELLVMKTLGQEAADSIEWSEAMKRASGTGGRANGRGRRRERCSASPGATKEERQ